MARQKAQNRVPPVNNTRRAGRAWDSFFLGQNNYGEETIVPRRSFIPNQGAFGDSAALAHESRANSDLQTLQALNAANQGDDRALLPYQPTPTINPGRPRTLAAGYDENTRTMRVKFRDGEIYEYYRVPPSVWWKFQRAQSPGRYINTTLNRYPYKRGI